MLGIKVDRSDGANDEEGYRDVGSGDKVVRETYLRKNKKKDMKET